VHGGFISFADDKLSVLAEIAELAEEIDVERAQQDLERARASEDGHRRAPRRGSPHRRNGHALTTSRKPREACGGVPRLRHIRHPCRRVFLFVTLSVERGGRWA